MFWAFFWLELKLRIRSVSTYVFFLIPFLMMFLAVSVPDFALIAPGKVLLNGPYALLESFGQITGFGSILIAAIFGPAMLRDFQQDTYSLIFTKPVTKFDYLGGKWLASFVLTVGIFTGEVWGGMLGTIMPWADKTRLAPMHLAAYLQPFFEISVVNVFFLGALFYCVAALSRRIIVVYLQGVSLLALYLVLAFSVLATNRLERFWPSVVDPLGMVFMSSIMRYWTVVERNSRLLSWTGPFLYNRMLWTGIGCLALLVTYVFFPMSAEVLAERRERRRKRDLVEDEAPPRGGPRFSPLPAVTQNFSKPTAWRQLASMTRTRVRNIVHEIPFWAIVLLMVILCAINGVFAGETRGTKVWPVTYLMLGGLQSGANLFLYIIAALYAGELIWRDRDANFGQIHDALPHKDWSDWLSKFAALLLIETGLLTIVMVVGILIQTANGFYRYELLHYCKDLYLIWLPQIMMVVLLALLVHTLVSNKFVGHAIIVGFFLISPIIARSGIENRLFLYGEVTPYTYSDMNGYGHFAPALFWITLYWLGVGGVFGVLATLFARRGTETGWAFRRKLARERVNQVSRFGMLAVMVAIAAGAWFYYNAHVENKYRTSKEERGRQAEYERRYRKYEKLPQPKITAVDLALDLFPERRSFVAHGHYVLVNRTDTPIGEIHIAEAQESVNEIRFDRAAQLKLSDKMHFYEIYSLDEPLRPGDTLKMDFIASHSTKGFRDGGEPAELAYNGTFFDRDYFPVIGYTREIELSDPLHRKEQKLGEVEDYAPRGDPYYSNLTAFAPDSDWVAFHCLVSTSADQVAVAPGYLERDWEKDGRHFFEYDMGEVRINNLFSILSARYQIRRDKWKNVNLEVYYNPGHEYNLDTMIDSTKAGLDYYEQNFGPYQFNQYRVLEFPRYRTFAQSFPNTVPFSEGIGFIQRRRNPDDIDLLYFVNAHELAHQWWGHQLVGSMTQGANVLSESLAEYSALKVMEKKYGVDNVRKFLRYELDGYLRGRAGETGRETPLALVQREPYVWYQKGGMVLYALGDYIGEDKLNAAIRGYLDKNKYARPPYPDTRGFIEALRTATPADLQYLISDMFESIVLYENKAVSAIVVPENDGKYKVTLVVDAAKKKSDGSGNESPMALNDLIEVGVFSGTREHLKPLSLQKRWFQKERSTIDIEVNSKPTFAGIDPYNKLIDRNPEDNLISEDARTGH